MKFCLKDYASPLLTHLDLSRIDREALSARADMMRAQAGEFISCADRITRHAMEKVLTFSLLDFAFLKVCLLSLGLWLGASLARFLRRFRVVLFLGFIVSYIYLVWRIFLRDE